MPDYYTVAESVTAEIVVHRSRFRCEVARAENVLRAGDAIIVDVRCAERATFTVLVARDRLDAVTAWVAEHTAGRGALASTGHQWADLPPGA